ncbi:MAG: hypothetical protein ABIS27_13600 [Longimicrobiales bacterium]
MISKWHGVFAASLILLSSPLAAQKNPPPREPPPERVFRVGLGVLVGSAGLGGAVDASLNVGARLYRFRLSAQSNDVMAASSPDVRLSITESAFMLGRGRRYRVNYGSVAAGLALVNVSRGSDDAVKTTVGIPVEAQLISRGPIRLGATLAGNLNLEQPFAAFILSVQLGRVPSR